MFFFFAHVPFSEFFFVPFPLSLCIMESTSYVLSFRMVFFYLVTTGWIFDTSLCENSINQSISQVCITIHCTVQYIVWPVAKREFSVYDCTGKYLCVCFLPIYSGHQVRWTYQPGSHRRKVTQDFSSTCFLRCVPSFFSREGFSHSFPSSTVKSNCVY